MLEAGKPLKAVMRALLFRRILGAAESGGEFVNLNDPFNVVI